MNKYFLCLFLFINVSLYSVEFVLFTQPKTGTHLLIPILTELTQKEVYWAPEHTKNSGSLKGSYEEASKIPNNFLFSLQGAPWGRKKMDEVWSINKRKNAYLHLHAPYSRAMENYLAEKNAITFFVKRDPRDQIVSLLNHYKYINFNDKEVESLLSDDERLLYMIRKESRISTVHFMNWIKSPFCCALDFEMLMGEHGGAATLTEALIEMRKISNVLQLELNDRQLEEVYFRHFGQGWSFFKGKVGAWKDYFKEEHKAAMKEEIGELLIQLGYEKDLEW